MSLNSHLSAAAVVFAGMLGSASSQALRGLSNTGTQADVSCSKGLFGGLPQTEDCTTYNSMCVYGFAIAFAFTASRWVHVSLELYKLKKELAASGYVQVGAGPLHQ